jgi:hypothetical protein
MSTRPPRRAGQSSLDVALDALKRFPRLHLFPVAPENKAQPLLKNYLKRASNDGARLRQWHAYWKTKFDGKECWWGIAPELSGLVFADVDTKVGKHGQETFELFDLLYGWPSTLVVGSPSGGRHHWYRGRHLFALGTNRSKHPGIDFAQYVILPGCMKADGVGYTLQEESPIAIAPDWFYTEAKPSPDISDAVEQVPVIDLDRPENVDWARHYLQHDAPQSIAGQGGEQTTLEVATVLKDYGISEATALELMAEFYNVPDKCDPIWSMDETPPEDSLPVKVHNAYVYKRKTAPGALSAVAEFANDDPGEITPMGPTPVTIHGRTFPVVRDRRPRPRKKKGQANAT